MWKSVVYGCGKSLENFGDFFSLQLCGYPAKSKEYFTCMNIQKLTFTVVQTDSVDFVTVSQISLAQCFFRFIFQLVFQHSFSVLFSFRFCKYYHFFRLVGSFDPQKPVPDMTCNVFGGTLKPCSINQSDAAQ